MIHAITLLLVFQLLGELVANGLGLPIPGPVIGMLALFAWLLIRPPTEALDKLANGLVKHLALLFLPAAVGIMVHRDLLANEWLGLLLMMILSTAITMAVTALTLQWLIRKTESQPGKSR